MTTDTLLPLAEVAHAQSAELLDVVTLLHFAINEANECTFEGEEPTESSGMTDRHSRLIALLGMAKDRVGAVVHKFDPYI